MPETLSIGRERYRLSSIAFHQGAHYWAYVNKNGLWYTANDGSISRTRPSDLTNGLKLGYLYYYDKIS